MKLILIILMSITVFMKAFSQEIICCEDDTCGFSKIYDEKILSKAITDNSLNYNNQYLDPWYKGDIFFEDGKIIKNVLLRLNAFKNELMLLRQPDYQTGIVYKPFVESFKLYDKNNNSPVLYKKIWLKNWYAFDSLNVFLQVLIEGRISLYLHKYLMSSGSSNEMIPFTEYILLKNGVFHIFKPNRFTLLRLIGNDKEKMKQVLRSEHLWVRREQELIKAINIFNENNK